MIQIDGECSLSLISLFCNFITENDDEVSEVHNVLIAVILVCEVSYQSSVD